MARARQVTAHRKVQKVVDGKVVATMTLEAITASGLVYGTDETWEYADGGGSDVKPGGDSMTEQKKAPTGLVASGSNEPAPRPVAEDPKPDPEAEPDESVPMPDGRASQETWIDYAVSQGFDRAELERMPKSEIRALFAEKE